MAIHSATSARFFTGWLYKKKRHLKRKLYQLRITQIRDFIIIQIKTMKKTYKYFIPSLDAELLRWLNNFKERIVVAGPSLGLTATQITELEDKAQKGIDTLLAVVFKKREYQEAVMAKNRARMEEVSFIANAAVVLKRSPLYTANVGGALGIISSTGTQSRVMLRPLLKVNVFPEHVELAFNKRGQGGVTIFSRLHGTEEWTRLADVERSPYKDTRPLKVPGSAEVREYICRCYNADEAVGQDSEVHTAVFGGITTGATSS